MRFEDQAKSTIFSQLMPKSSETAVSPCALSRRRHPACRLFLELYIYRPRDHMLRFHRKVVLLSRNHLAVKQSLRCQHGPRLASILRCSDITDQHLGVDGAASRATLFFDLWHHLGDYGVLDASLDLVDVDLGKELFLSCVMIVGESSL